MSSFSFNFIPSDSGNEAVADTSRSSVVVSVSDPTPVEVEIKRPFVWTKNLYTKFFQKCTLEPPNHEWIALTSSQSKSMVSPPTCVARVRERSQASHHCHQGTDLIPGVYEGGDVVWECSLDLCRFLYENNILIQGHVLELGCGHGLPGCWVLRQAKLRGDNSTSVCFTDYNEFVLETTMSTIILNLAMSYHDGDPNNNDMKTLAHWLAQHASLGSGDWNSLSITLLETSGEARSIPNGVPMDGLFDYILAAETTYSTNAAMDTARFIIRHLRQGSGIAYVATKRYYFGIGGGSEAFREGLRLFSSSSIEVKVDVLQVYDNGAGNIRELLRVQLSSSSS